MNLRKNFLGQEDMNIFKKSKYVSPAPWYAGERFRISKLISLCDNLENKVILDMGSGGGHLSKYLAQNKKNKVFAIDNEDFPSYYTGTDVRFKSHDLNSGLPFENGHFDVVFACEVLEHLEDVNSALKEVHRVLKSGGTLIVDVPSLSWNIFSSVFGTFYPLYRPLRERLMQHFMKKNKADSQSEMGDILRKNFRSGGLGYLKFLILADNWLYQTYYSKINHPNKFPSYKWERLFKEGGFTIKDIRGVYIFPFTSALPEALQEKIFQFEMKCDDMGLLRYTSLYTLFILQKTSSKPKMNDDVRVFDQMSEDGHSYVYTDESLKLLDEIIPKNVKILDVGCGTGHIAERLTDREWYGVDISPKSIMWAKNYYIEAKVGDVTKKIPFNDKTFDVVLSLSTLHHIPDYFDGVFKEMSRVLKDGGILIAIEHDARNIYARLSHHPKSPIRVVPSKHERALYSKELEPYLVKYGFTEYSFEPIEILASQQGYFSPIYLRALRILPLILIKLISRGKADQFLLRAVKGRVG